MIELFTQYRVPINLLLILVLACFVLFRLISLMRNQLSHAAPEHSPGAGPEHPLLRAVDAAATIGVGIAWTALIYAGPSLSQLWQGQGSASHWMVVLLYTWLWLSARPAVPAKGAAAVLTSTAVRAALYGLFFTAVIATLNNG